MITTYQYYKEIRAASVQIQRGIFLYQTLNYFIQSKPKEKPQDFQFILLEKDEEDFEKITLI
jgi:hypothetical protein